MWNFPRDIFSVCHDLHIHIRYSCICESQAALRKRHKVSFGGPLNPRMLVRVLRLLPAGGTLCDVFIILRETHSLCRCDGHSSIFKGCNVLHSKKESIHIFHFSTASGQRLASSLRLSDLTQGLRNCVCANWLLKCLVFQATSLSRFDTVIRKSYNGPDQAIQNNNSFPRGNQQRRAWNGELCQVKLCCGANTADHI